MTVCKHGFKSEHCPQTECRLERIEEKLSFFDAPRPNELEDLLKQVAYIEGKPLAVFETQRAKLRCEHEVKEQTAKWHRYHRRSEPNRCHLNASINFNGKYYCRRHAGMVALNLLMAESRSGDEEAP